MFVTEIYFYDGWFRFGPDHDSWDSAQHDIDAFCKHNGLAKPPWLRVRDEYDAQDATLLDILKYICPPPQ